MINLEDAVCAVAAELYGVTLTDVSIFSPTPFISVIYIKVG